MGYQSMSILGAMAVRCRLLPFRGCVAVLLVLLAGSAAAQSPAVSSQESRAVGDQVLATVNGKPILRQEVDFVLKRSASPGMSEEASAARRRAILADLIRAESLAQYAVSKGLEDEAQLALELRIARRQSLAAKVQQAEGETAELISPEEARNLVTGNPLLFSLRKQYTLEEIQLQTPDPDLFRKLDLAIRRTDADIDRAQRLAVESGATTQRRIFATQSEGLPAQLVEPLANARVGQVFVLQYSADRGALLAVKAAVAAPLVGAEATRAAMALGSDVRRRQTASQRSQEVVNRARINYTDAATALSAPAVAAAASAPKLPAPSISGASAPAGPVIMPPEPLADLPRGLPETPRLIQLRRLAIGVGAVLVGGLLLLMLVAVVRSSFERYWLPHLWPLQAPMQTPSLLRVLAEAIVQPSTVSVPWATIGLRMLALLGLLLCGVLAVMAYSAGLKHVPQWMLLTGAGVGWLMGIVASHFKARRLHKLERRPRLSAGPAFFYQALLLLVCGLAVRFL